MTDRGAKINARPGPKRTFGTEPGWEVVKLVARGLTNRQIAARLVISESTAETHLARIFKKVGLHSRTQLTVWVNGRGLSSSNSS